MRLEPDTRTDRLERQCRRDAPPDGYAVHCPCHLDTPKGSTK